MNTRNFYLEHANITVKNIDNSIRFFQTAFPEMEVRGGDRQAARPWIHLGTDETYLALNERPGLEAPQGAYDFTTGFNHIGFVVENVEALAERMKKAGYQRSYPKQMQQFRIRDYFLDPDGNEYEFVQYLSEKDNERNDYSE